MLYLNSRIGFINSIPSPYLTLTSVVFEYKGFKQDKIIPVNLTLTSVVFEFSYNTRYFIHTQYLTLTSVVFESYY